MNFITKHANVRIKQRGFKQIHLDILTIFGEEAKVPGGAVEVRISHKRRSEIIQALDKAINKALIVSESDGSLITVLNKG